MKGPVFLGLEEIIEIHHDQINRYGGRSGMRDIGLLKSTAAMPAMRFGGDYLHDDILTMAAAYLFHITRNHPFIDGNKRTGAAALLVFLLMNGIELNADEYSFERLVRSVAEGKTDKAAIVRFLRENTVSESLAEDAKDIEAFEERAKEPLISYNDMVRKLKKADKE